MQVMLVCDACWCAQRDLPMCGSVAKSSWNASPSNQLGSRGHHFLTVTSSFSAESRNKHTSFRKEISENFLENKSKCRLYFNTEAN